jgi:WD40 repeat protein
MGTTDGNIGVYNVNNGALLKSLKKHNSEIVSLIHAVSLPSEANPNAFRPNYIISRSIDNVVQVYSDDDINESECLKPIEVKDNN